LFRGCSGTPKGAQPEFILKALTCKSQAAHGVDGLLGSHSTHLLAVHSKVLDLCSKGCSGYSEGKAHPGLVALWVCAEGTNSLTWATTRRAKKKNFVVTLESSESIPVESMSLHYMPVAQQGASQVINTLALIYFLFFYSQDWVAKYRPGDCSDGVDDNGQEGALAISNCFFLSFFDCFFSCFRLRVVYLPQQTLFGWGR